jgi:hypothetical protein
MSEILDFIVIGSGIEYFFSPLRKSKNFTTKVRFLFFTKHQLIRISIGLSGLAFARFQLDIHPEARLTILEADDCLGGVWSWCT